jgi:hypothetical protein
MRIHLVFKRLGHANWGNPGRKSQVNVERRREETDWAVKIVFMAKVPEDYFDGSARKAETYLGSVDHKELRQGLNQ